MNSLNLEKARAARGERRDATDLDRLYGRIGIPAVAAAARYPAAAQDQAPAGTEPASRREDDDSGR
jgi:hypothetical protein